MTNNLIINPVNQHDETLLAVMTAATAAGLHAVIYVAFKGDGELDPTTERLVGVGIPLTLWSMVAHRRGWRLPFAIAALWGIFAACGIGYAVLLRWRNSKYGYLVAAGRVACVDARVASVMKLQENASALLAEMDEDFQTVMAALNEMDGAARHRSDGRARKMIAQMERALLVVKEKGRAAKSLSSAACNTLLYLEARDGGKNG